MDSRAGSWTNWYSENRFNWLIFVILESTEHEATTSGPTKNQLNREELQDASEFSKRRELILVLPLIFTEYIQQDPSSQTRPRFRTVKRVTTTMTSWSQTQMSQRKSSTGPRRGKARPQMVDMVRFISEPTVLIFQCYIMFSAWFKQPKHMPYWLFLFFIEKVGPLIFKRKGKHLSPPESFSNRSGAPGSLWLHPPAPIISLSSYTFTPELLYRPRIFLWLPHFFVETMRCPNCHRALEKNGACPPRRITDTSDSFWIVTWAYYCRSGCQSHFRGWSPAILESLPQYLRLEFPAILSRKSGLSVSVVNQLRVGNQHKMGPGGVRSLLFEEHTRKFNMLCLQYLEAIYEVVHGRQEDENNSHSAQSTLDSYMAKKYASFGNFSDPEKYAGFVPSKFFLAQMMNRVIEQDEPNANQHTSCIGPDQISIDDSHKVN